MKYHHLTTDARCQIYALKSMGKKQNEIAKHLGVSAPTICRELKRNAGKKGYRYKLADAKAINKGSSIHLTLFVTLKCVNKATCQMNT
jgi:IS30 family transposase